MIPKAARPRSGTARDTPGRGPFGRRDAGHAAGPARARPEGRLRRHQPEQLLGRARPLLRPAAESLLAGVLALAAERADPAGARPRPARPGGRPSAARVRLRLHRRRQAALEQRGRAAAGRLRALGARPAAAPGRVVAVGALLPRHDGVPPVPPLGARAGSAGAPGRAGRAAGDARRRAHLRRAEPEPGQRAREPERPGRLVRSTGRLRRTNRLDCRTGHFETVVRNRRGRHPVTGARRRNEERVSALKHLLAYVYPHRRLAYSTIGFHLLQVALAMVLPQLLRYAIDVGLGEKNFRFLLLAAMLTIVLALIRDAIWYRVTSGYQRFASSVSFDLRDRIFETVQRSSYTYTTRARSGHLLALSATDTSAVEEFLNSGLNSLCNLIFLFVLIVAILLTIHPGLTLIAALVLPPVAAVGLMYSRPARERSRRIQHQYGQLTAMLQENLTGMRVVKAFAAEPREGGKFREQADELFDASFRLGALNAWVFPLMNLITAVGIGAVYWVGGERVLSGQLTLGALIAFTQYLAMIVQPVRQ